MNMRAKTAEDTGADPYRDVRMDRSTHSLQVIDYAHHEIHSGSAYVVSQRTAVNAFDIATPMSFLITVADTAKWPHITISGEANTPAYWELFEDDGNGDHFTVVDGSAVTPTNRNRNSSKTAGVVIASGPTVTNATADVLLCTEAIAKSASGGDRHEFILKQNTKYLVRATAYTNDNEGSLSLDWYEHEDKG